MRCACTVLSCAVWFVADLAELAKSHTPRYAKHARTTPILEHPICNTHRSETQMLRYLYKLQVANSTHWLPRTLLLAIVCVEIARAVASFFFFTRLLGYVS